MRDSICGLLFIKSLLQLTFELNCAKIYLCRNQANVYKSKEYIYPKMIDILKGDKGYEKYF